MKSAGARESLVRFLSARGLDAAAMGVAETVATMMDWYGQERFEDAADLDADDDMLLCQWGAYDFGKGLAFRYDMTRQLVAATDSAHPDDSDMWQLQWTRHYEPTAVLRKLGSGNRWCYHPTAIGEFRRYVEAHDVTQVVTDLEPIRITIERSLV